MSSEFHLFRPKFIRPKQTDFLHDDDTPTALFVRALEERPQTQFKKQYTWHIANLKFFTGTTGYFAVGRDSPTSIPKRDRETGDFFKTEDDTSPFTFAVFDATLGLLAVKRESTLAPSTYAIVSKICRLLSITTPIVKNQIHVEIDPIPDPTDFIARLNAAISIKKFTATFTGPNPFDADEIFQKPLAVYLQAAKGETGHATIQGSNLSAEVVTAVARSTASTGNSATAKVQEQVGMRAVRITMERGPVTIAYDSDNPSAPEVLADAQKAYAKVRHE